MTRLRFVNESELSLRLMLEPRTDEFDIPPSGSADVIFSVSLDVIQIDYHEDNFISIWTEGDTQVIVSAESI